MLTKNLKLSDTAKKEFLEQIFFQMIKKDEKNTVAQI